MCDNLQKSLLVIFSSLGVLGVDQQLLLEGKRLPLSDEESLPLEKNEYLVPRLQQIKAPLVRRRGVESVNGNSRASQETK